MTKISSKLQLEFLNDTNTISKISITDPREDLTGAEVGNEMMQMISSGAYNENTQLEKISLAYYEYQFLESITIPDGIIES